MEIKNYFKLVTINLIRYKKINIRNLFMMILSFVLFSTTVLISTSLNKFIDTNILNSIEHNSIMIEYTQEYENTQDKIKQLLTEEEEVIDYYEYEMPIAGEIRNQKELSLENKTNSLLVRTGFSKKMPTIVKGELFNTKDKNVGIIPKNFDTSGEMFAEVTKESKEYLDGEDFLGKNITLEFSYGDGQDKKSFTYSFKVVGVYDAVENMDYPSDVYISHSDLKLITSKYNEIINDGSSDYTIKTILALLNNKDDINRVINTLNDNEGIYAYKRAEVGPIQQISDLIMLIGTGISGIIFISVVINISIANVNLIKRRASEIGILKILGYTNKNIISILMGESFVLNSMSLTISLLLVNSLSSMLNKLVIRDMSIYMRQLSFDINNVTICVGIIIMIFSIVLSNIKAIKSIVNISPIRAIKSKY